MKIANTLRLRDASAAQVDHKALQHRRHGSKVSSHRYERRKVRAGLRHVELFSEESAT
jgi:hypothetical protein